MLQSQSFDFPRGGGGDSPTPRRSGGGAASGSARFPHIPEHESYRPLPRSEVEHLLTPAQRAADARFKAETGRSFPTLTFDGKPTWGGKKLILVNTSHPSVQCEQRAGARLIVTDAAGQHYAYPESWGCTAAEDESGSSATKFNRSLALLTFYHSYMHASNTLKRKIAEKQIVEALNKLVNPHWMDEIGLKCLKAVLMMSNPVPSDIPNLPQFRRDWARVATAKPGDTVHVNFMDPMTGEVKALTGADSGGQAVRGGWYGCAQMSKIGRASCRERVSSPV